MDNLVKKLNALLLEKSLTLATAESCTGGMLSAAITAHAGSSKIFDRGFITYSNSAKQEMLGVSLELLDNHGAVSEQCARAMAIGAINNSHAKIAVSITGIAGPQSDDTNKPVGLVYIGTSLSGHNNYVSKFHFTGTREQIRFKSCEAALEGLLNIAERYNI